MFQEFPKGLNKGGAEGEWLVVFNADEEKDARKDGWTSLGEEVVERKKPGPKPKVVE